MTNYYRDEMKVRSVCYSSADELIRAKRLALSPDFDFDANSKIISSHVIQNYLKKPKDSGDIPTRKIFIDHVISNDTKFTDSEVRDHVYTVVAAGSETTALQTAHTSEFRKFIGDSTQLTHRKIIYDCDKFLLIFYAVMLLATHPVVQEQVASEIKEVFYSDDIEFSYDNLSKMEYLERVIKESLRLCPVVPSEFVNFQY